MLESYESVKVFYFCNFSFLNDYLGINQDSRFWVKKGSGVSRVRMVSSKKAQER